MWNVTDWQKVVFSDESRFVLGIDDNRVRVWKRPSERYNSPYTVLRHTARTARVMVRGAIAYDSQSTLIVMRETLTGQLYVDCILRPHTVLEAKREEFVDDALICTKSLCEKLEISFEPPRRIRRKHIFGDGSKDDQLSYEDDLRRSMFSSVHRVTAKIRERFQKVQNLAQKYAFLRPEVILSMTYLKLYRSSFSRQ
ncbi:uncharacterized protein TNCV_1217981 [Trichonephila clavipes]|nr:uncharacterized protein TNCV_1217981 [Trichonephila clavipes]